MRAGTEEKKMTPTSLEKREWYKEKGKAAKKSWLSGASVRGNSFNRRGKNRLKSFELR